MKNFILFIVLFTISVFSAELKVTGFDTRDSEKTANELIEDLGYFLDKPLNWCKVTPTGDINLIRQDLNDSKVLIKFKVECDHSEARMKLKKFWNKYDSFLHSNGELVDWKIERMYPDYQLRWGFAMNDYTFIQLYLLSNFGGDKSNHNKCVFFRLIINDEMKTIPFRINMPGSTMKIIPSNTIPNEVDYEYSFVVSIPNEYLKEGNLDIKVKRVWHLVNGERYKKVNNLY